MNFEKPVNPNYCASIVRLNKIIPHSNADKLAIATIQGCSVIVGKETKEGDIGIFFPLETQLAPDFLSYNNLYRDTKKNRDQTKAGFFEENGRIRAVKLRGEKSEGLFVGLDSLGYLLSQEEIAALGEGFDFDRVKGKMICCKFLVKTPPSSELNAKGGSKKRAPLDSRLVEGQFSLHIDTEKLNKNMHKINPESIISITSKWHGTSFVVGNVLTKKKTNLLEKMIIKIFGVSDKMYSIVYSSRKVIKNAFFETKELKHYYKYDIWGDIAAKLGPIIPEGVTIYGEAVGYAKESAIQKGYHYGCKPGSYRIVIYRITKVSPDGQTIEFSWGQIKDFCKKNGLETVPEFFYGRAKDLYSDIQLNEEWSSNFLNRLNRDQMFGMGDVMCPFNNGEVPSEGIVLKVDNLYEDKVYKLKNFRFLEAETKALDQGEISMEDNG